MSDDVYVQNVLQKDPRKQEALAWLKLSDGKERTIGDGNQDATASLHLVQDLYQHGAVEVTAIDIDVDTHMETTSTLIVKLPDEAAARKRVLQSEAKVARLGGFDPVPDEGQRYVMLHW